MYGYIHSNTRKETGVTASSQFNMKNRYLKKALQSCTRMFRSLTIISMRKAYDKASLAEPF
jgi:hypothetical protein